MWKILSLLSRQLAGKWDGVSISAAEFQHLAGRRRRQRARDIDLFRRQKSRPCDLDNNRNPDGQRTAWLLMKETNPYRGPIGSPNTPALVFRMTYIIHSHRWDSSYRVRRRAVLQINRETAALVKIADCVLHPNFKAKWRMRGKIAAPDNANRPRDDEKKDAGTTVAWGGSDSKMIEFCLFDASWVLIIVRRPIPGRMSCSFQVLLGQLCSDMGTVRS